MLRFMQPLRDIRSSNPVMAETPGQNVSIWLGRHRLSLDKQHLVRGDQGSEVLFGTAEVTGLGQHRHHSAAQRVEFRLPIRFSRTFDDPPLVIVSSNRARDGAGPESGQDDYLLETNDVSDEGFTLILRPQCPKGAHNCVFDWAAMERPIFLLRPFGQRAS